MKEKTLHLTRAALIAALYVILTFLAQIFGLASGAIQFRLSEALTCMPLFYKEAIPGLWIGCILANLLTGCSVAFRPSTTTATSACGYSRQSAESTTECGTS